VAAGSRCGQTCELLQNIPRLCNIGRLFRQSSPFTGIEQPFAFVEAVAEPHSVHNRVIFCKSYRFSAHATRIPAQKRASLRGSRKAARDMPVDACEKAVAKRCTRATARNVVSCKPNAATSSYASHSRQHCRTQPQAVMSLRAGIRLRLPLVSSLFTVL